MAELLTSAQMRAIEAAAIDGGAVTGLELMERAGQGVVEAVFAEWPELAATSHRAVVLCGPGNNGGDGFVVARLLKGWGWEVEVFLYGDPAKLPPDARMNYERWVEVGAVQALTAAESWQDVGSCLMDHEDQVVVDALFGTGLTRPLGEPVKSVLRALDDTLDQLVGYYVAVDVPSGLCADAGKPLGNTLRRADLTVTFHRAKTGHFLDDGPYCCGRLAIRDIGLADWAFSWKVEVDLPHASFETVRAAGKENSTRRPVQLVGRPAPRKVSGHKYSHGHALILSGPSGHTGAARLAARGALRVGAGLVTIGTPHDALGENAAQLTAIMLTEVDDAATLSRVLEDGRLNALALGPGLGLERARALVPVALAAGRATLLDADALTAFADAPGALFAQLHESCVLTPHGGEFAGLFPDIAAKLAAPPTRGPAYSKVDATREAAKRAGCTILFKGPDTVIAAPDGGAAINSAAYERAAPWLATAGSGDVLAGVITGLLARGFAPMQAAETGAWLHVEAALSFGPGLIAEDLPEELPKVFRALGL